MGTKKFPRVFRPPGYGPAENQAATCFSQCQVIAQLKDQDAMKIQFQNQTLT